jgi:MFS family permease
MSRNQKIFLAILGLYVIFDFVLGSLVGVFLWDQTKETPVILKYYFTLFAAIMVFSQASSFLIGKFGAKKVYIFSIFLGLIQAVFLLLFQRNISQLVILIGVISGASIGFQAVAYSIVASNITQGLDSSRFLGTKSALMNFVSIVSVPIITYLISLTGSYNISYILGLVSGGLVIFLITGLKIETVELPYRPLRYLPSALTGTDSRTYLLTRFVYGLFSGPVWAILGIVTFKFAGNLALWGIISTVFTILHIIGSYIYGKLNSRNLHKAYSVFATLIFASVTIMLATNWNFATFLIYQLGLVILNATFAIHYESLTYDLLASDGECASNKKELLGLGEIFIGIGRLVPLGLLLVINFSLEDNLVIQILFIAIASMPLIIINLLKNTSSYQNRYAKI